MGRLLASRNLKIMDQMTPLERKQSNPISKEPRTLRAIVAEHRETRHTRSWSNHPNIKAEHTEWHAETKFVANN